MNDERIEGKKKKVLLFSLPSPSAILYCDITLCSTESQPSFSGRRMEERKGVSKFVTASPPPQKNKIFCLSHRTFDINGRPNLLLADWIF